MKKFGWLVSVLTLLVARSAFAISDVLDGDADPGVKTADPSLFFARYFIWFVLGAAAVVFALLCCLDRPAKKA